MSYILEALKRSQQARELGRVPTLDTAGLPEDDSVEPVRVPWPLVATALAALAVLIALYGVMRGPQIRVDTIEGDRAPEPRAASAAARILAAPQPPAVPTQSQAAPSPLAPKDQPGVEQPAPVRSPQRPSGLSAVPLIEAPPPKGRIEAPEPARVPATPRSPSRAISSIPDEPIIHPDLSGEPGIDAEMELELQRQLEGEMAAIEGEEAGIGPAPTAIPADLIADIEAFKDRVREERGLPPNNRAKRQALPEGDLTKLRLTKAEKADLPLFVVTVHVYNAEPQRRFVVINGLKYREGNLTDEGLRVERILAEGVVLSHKGRPFFVRP